MKKYLFPFMLLVLLLSALPFLDQSNNKPLTGLPWQIEVMADGSTQVFGIHIGTSRLSYAIDVLGSDAEIAVMAAPGESGRLEMYYGHYRVGLLSGKMVLQAKTSAQDIQYWRDNAINSEPVPSGRARKYSLSEADLNDALNRVIDGITFIPSLKLDEEMILKRFGKPDERIELDGVTHYRYAAKGLDIALYADASEVFQYVSPNDFQRYMIAE